MSKWRFLVLLMIGLVVLAGVFFLFFRNGEDLEADECVKVQTTCCPCNMGGAEKCVLKSEAKEYEAKLLECSEGLICAAVFNCEIESCGYIDGECVAT